MARLSACFFFSFFFLGKGKLKEVSQGLVLTNLGRVRFAKWGEG